MTTVSPSLNTEPSSPSSFLPVRLRSDSSTGDPDKSSLSIGPSISNSELPISKFQTLRFSNSPHTDIPHVDFSNASFFHYSVSNHSSTMEADCEDVKLESLPHASSPDQMQQLFASLSDHISAQTNLIQLQIQQNDTKLTLAQNQFKEEVRQELDTFRNMLLTQQGISSSPVVTNSPPVVSDPSTSTSASTQVSTSPTVASNSSTDLQAQMMLLLSESFSKLSTALGDQKQDTKTEWHKFSGDGKKFRGWYLGIMAHISLPPWKDLYDPVRNDVVTSTKNTLLNGKLYSKILLSLDGTAYQNFVSRKHLRADGIRLLQELVQTYKPKNVPEVIAAKTVEFWGNTKRLPTETVDSYYDRFQELLEDLADSEEPISIKAAMRHFIFTLGCDFETIQNNFLINDPPQEWQTQDWPTLLTLCRDYHNSITSTSTFKRPGKDSGKDPKDSSFDREANKRKFGSGF
jgi:hypothetical protein